MGGDNQPTPAAKPAARWPWAKAGLLALLCAAAALAVGNLPGCQGYQTDYEKRVRHAMRGRGPVVIAVAASSSMPNLTREGAQLAADQINARGGVLGGRQIKLLHLDDQGRLPVAEKLARRLAGDPEVVAVVGHVLSEVAVPVSIIYGATGLLFITTGATDPQFNLIPNPLTIRVVPSDAVTARAMAELAAKLGLTKVVVMFQRGLYSSLYGLSLANFFAAFGPDYDVEILHMRSFFPWQDDLRPTLASLRQVEVQGLVVAGFLPQAGSLIQQFRSLGFKSTILSGDSLDNPRLLDFANQGAEGVIVASFFRPDLERPATRDFVEAFRRAHGKDPEETAAGAFDAVHLMALAVQKAGSSVPLDMANSMVFMGKIQGASSVYNFDIEGEPQDRWVWFKEVKHGQFAFLPNEYQPQDPTRLED